MSLAASQLRQTTSDAAGERPAQRATYGRFVRHVQHRWSVTRLVEVASIGWVLGLIPTVLLLAWHAGPAAALIPFISAMIAIAAGWRPVSAEAAADRIDAAFCTRELFGTAVRLRKTPDGAWLAAAADAATERLVLGEVPVARFGRWWWGGVAVLTCCAMAGGLLMHDGGVGKAPHVADGRLIRAGTLISGDASQERAVATDHDASAPSKPVSARGAAGTGRVFPAHTSTPDSTRPGSEGNADGASGGAASGGGAAVRGVSEGSAQQEPGGLSPSSSSDTGEAPGPGGGAAASSDRSRADSAGDGVADPSRPSTQDRGSTGRGEATAGDTMLRSVPPAYHDLVRRFFAGD